MSKQVELSISPTECLHDEPVTVRVQGLEPGQKVTLTSHTKEKTGIEFFSHSHYVSDACGVIDTTTSESLGGSYEGCFPMGFIMCMKPLLEKEILFKTTSFHMAFGSTSPDPIRLTLSVLDGHLPKEMAVLPSKDLILVSKKHIRHYLGPGVERIEMNTVKGVLFIPKGDGPFPGVIDMVYCHTTIMEFRAAMLASRGIAALALAFPYDMIGVAHPQDNPLTSTYVEEAAKAILRHNKVSKPHIGVMGVSSGCSPAAATTVQLDCVTAATLANGVPAMLDSYVKVGDRIFTPHKVRYDKAETIEPGLVCVANAFGDLTEDSNVIFPLQESNADFLFFVSNGDKSMRNRENIKTVIRHMEKHSYKRYEVYEYPGATHVIHPCYTNMFEMAYVVPYRSAVFFGGDEKGHCAAQEDAWERTIRFFKQKLMTKSIQKRNDK